MSRIPRSLFGALLVCVLLFAFDVAAADDDSFYESLPDVTIGKIFFSPQQRLNLDQRRGSGTRTGASVPSTRASRAVKDTGDAAGFIISSKGGAKIYANGDFVSARTGDAVVFPNTVKVVRSDENHESGAGDEDE